jgi:hypothetical protein
MTITLVSGRDTLREPLHGTPRPDLPGTQPNRESMTTTGLSGNPVTAAPRAFHADREPLVSRAIRPSLGNLLQ